MEKAFIIILAVWFLICLGKFLSNKMEEEASNGKGVNGIRWMVTHVLGGTVKVSETISKGLEKGIDTLDEINSRISVAKKITEIKELLTIFFGSPSLVEKRLLCELENVQNMEKQQLKDKKCDILSAEILEYTAALLEKSKKSYEPREGDQRAIEFLTSYQPWPFDLLPENLQSYSEGIIAWGHGREDFLLNKKYPREICEKHFRNDVRLKTLFSEDKNDYFGTFLGYADAMEKGEVAAIKYDLQVRLLRFATSYDTSFKPCDIVCHCANLSKSAKLNIADDWFINVVIANDYDSNRWGDVYHWLEAYVDIDSLREALDRAELKKISANVKRLLAIADSLKVDDSLDLEFFNKRSDRAEIKKFIDSNHIQALYHFTAESNLESIRKSGGLFSWKYLQNHSIFYEGGGNEDSKSLDLRKHLENYVRLSFCKDHPMSFHVRNRIKGELVLLEIDPSILFKEGVLVSDINAADNCAKIQEAAQGLESINYPATQRTYVNREDPDFKQHQAEILVPEIVPLSFIKNIN